ncbi:phytanoyl-CoA dioxygenase [Paenibacillus sambharensis]|uniref:Phytanoyl-CoA dioxygenase n=1 Tax=Paenibacillus sambharensis TaxID=1803190 RepID=A0A2W1LFJ6_9BACL|nr:phytanoyl-CoA dioxygenase family protein [Paenibacillus sambharensis]PZD96820.1 phytanoyl-CoA dioxygenase [Paenibacillus sambharensis]
MPEWIGEAERKAFREQGYVKIPGVYSREQIDQVKSAYEQYWLKLVAAGEIIAKGKRPLERLFPRMRDYHRKNEAIARFVLDPASFDIVESLIGEEAYIISTSYYFKSPTTRALPLHQDNYAFGVEPGTTYAFWVSLDSSDEENGGLQFVPGTHHLELMLPETNPGDVRHYFSDEGQRIDVPEDAGLIHVDTEPGDIVVFDGNIIHGSSANVSCDRYRRSLLTHFCAASVEKLALNFNNLLDKHGQRVRKRLNTHTKITETPGSVFAIKEANYFDSWK